MKKSKKDKHFINYASYPGGPKALWAFIRKNLRYPEAAQKEKISGVVRLKYSLDGDGKVIATKVIHSLGYGCDEEAIRVIKLLKYHVPKQRKIKVKFHKTINIRFKPPKKKTVKITLTKKKTKSAKDPKSKEKTSYGYSIPLKN
jgi:protein TonB